MSETELVSDPDGGVTAPMEETVVERTSWTSSKSGPRLPAVAVPLVVSDAVQIG